MGVLSKLFGAGDVVEAAGGVLDRLFTSDDERLTHAEIMERIKQRPDLAQIEVNKTEVKHRSVWVAGWRPYIGWTCGTAVAYNFILAPLLWWLFIIFAPDTPPPPRLDISELVTILLSMLGFGYMRSQDKRAGAGAA